MHDTFTHKVIAVWILFALTYTVAIDNNQRQVHVHASSSSNEQDIPFTQDSDGDGIPNTIDTDDDNDGTADNDDYAPLNPLVSGPTRNSQTISVSADAPLMSNTATRANTNYGTSAQAETRNSQRSFVMKFTIPSGITVASADINIFTNTENDPLTVYEMANTTWSENVITANSAPLSDITRIATTTAPVSGVYTVPLTSTFLPSAGTTKSYYILDSEDPSGAIESVYMRETSGKAAQLNLDYYDIPPNKLVVTSPTILRLYEDSTSGLSFDIALTAAPSSTVYVPVTTSNSDVANVVGTQYLVFSPLNWSQSQTVTLQANAAGSTSLIIRPLHSTDANFNGVNPSDIANIVVQTTNITNQEEIVVATGDAFTRTLLPVSSSGAQAHTFKVIQAPIGMSIVSGSGRVAFRPTSNQIGTYTLEFTVTNEFDEVSRFVIPVRVTSSTDPDLTGSYVVPGSGTDSPSAGTVDNPFNSISYAVSRATSGGTVYIRGGDYTLSSKETIATAASSEVIITPLVGEYVRLQFNDTIGFDVTSTARNITFEGLEIDGNSGVVDHWTILSQGFWDNSQITRGGGIAIQVNGTDIAIKNNAIHDAYQKAVNIQDGRYVTITGNVIYNIATTSLSGGHGIMRQQRYGGFGDADDPSKYRWDISNNLMFNIEQRIYSWVQSKGYMNMVLDEGKPILIDEPSSTGQQMRARISNNVVLFSAIDSMVLKSTPGLEVSNNSIYSHQSHADGITDRNESGLFSNFSLLRNAVQTASGTTAIDVADAVADGSATVANNVIAGGASSTLTGITSYGTTAQLFTDPINGDMTLRAGIPSTVGVDQTIHQELITRAAYFGVQVEWSGWLFDHMKMTQTLLDNIPGVNDGVVGNETVFTDGGAYGVSSLEPGRNAIEFDVVNGAWKTRTGSTATQEVILPLDYTDWYDDIAATYRQANGTDYGQIRWGESIVAQDQVFASDGLFVAKVYNTSSATQMSAPTSTVTLAGDILVDFSEYTPQDGDMFDLILAQTISTGATPFNRVRFVGYTPSTYTLLPVDQTNADGTTSSVLRLTIGDVSTSGTATVIATATRTATATATRTATATATRTATATATRTATLSHPYGNTYSHPYGDTYANAYYQAECICENITTEQCAKPASNSGTYVGYQ